MFFPILKGEKHILTCQPIQMDLTNMPTKLLDSEDEAIICGWWCQSTPCSPQLINKLDQITPCIIWTSQVTTSSYHFCLTHNWKFLPNWSHTSSKAKAKVTIRVNRALIAQVGMLCMSKIEAMNKHIFPSFPSNMFWWTEKQTVQWKCDAQCCSCLLDTMDWDCIASFFQWSLDVMADG